MVNSKLRGQTAAMDNPVLEKITAYWDQIRAGRIAPFRSEFDPKQIEDSIENVFILEKLGEYDIRFRLAGRRINESLGTEARGLPATELVALPDRARFAAILNDLLEHPSTACIAFDVRNAQGRSWREDMILLPMQSDDARVSRILGCYNSATNGSATLVERRIFSSSSTKISLEQTDLLKVSLPGFAEPNHNFDHSQGPILVAESPLPATTFATSFKGKRPELKLVK